MSSKKNGVQYHNPDHVLVALACIITLAVIIGYMMAKAAPAPGISGQLPTPSGSMMEQPQDIETMCTADAMGCPDGSYVGRTGPNCEFAACPGYN